MWLNLCFSRSMEGVFSGRLHMCSMLLLSERAGTAAVLVITASTDRQRV